MKNSITRTNCSKKDLQFSNEQVFRADTLFNLQFKKKIHMRFHDALSQEKLEQP